MGKAATSSPSVLLQERRRSLRDDDGIKTLLVEIPESEGLRYSSEMCTSYCV